MGDVGRHNAPRDVGHTAGHDGHQLAAGSLRQERADGERSLGLAHEDGCRHVHALSAGDTHGLEHDPGHAANEDLHNADVVENGEKRGDEDDGGQYLEGKDGALIRRIRR